MRIEITAGGIYGAEGEIPVGTELTVKAEPKGWAGRYRVIGRGADGRTAITNPADEFVPPVGPFEAKEKAAGWWAIFDGAGEVVGKAVRKDALDGFNDLGDDDKLAFAVEHAKAAD